MSYAPQETAVAHGVVVAFVPLIHQLVVQQQDLATQNVDFISWWHTWDVVSITCIRQDLLFCALTFNSCLFLKKSSLRLPKTTSKYVLFYFPGKKICKQADDIHVTSNSTWFNSIKVGCQRCPLTIYKIMF